MTAPPMRRAALLLRQSQAQGRHGEVLFSERNVRETSGLAGGIPSRYFLFLTNSYHRPPQAASEKPAEQPVAATGVSHCPEMGKRALTLGPKKPRCPRPALFQSYQPGQKPTTAYSSPKATRRKPVPFTLQHGWGRGQGDTSGHLSRAHSTGNRK